MPILTVQINNPATHSPPTKRFEALIDSGAGDTIFLADIGRSIGIKVEKGVKSVVTGIVPGAHLDVYFHDVGLYVGAGIVRIRAGFADGLSIGAILGRRGFFEHFIVTFDPSANPPGFDLERIARA
jgi:hypothetical protein